MNEARYLAGLNSGQREAVLEPGNLLVIAGAGSGKTTTLSRRIARLVSDSPTNRVIAVTFTRDAAQELAERATSATDASGAKRIRAGTFHALCYRHLAEHGTRPTVLHGHASYEYAGRAAHLAHVEFSPDEALAHIETAKLGVHAGVRPTADDARLLQHYEDLLARNHESDFMDLLRMVCEGVKAGTLPPLPATHLLVDEFQDTDLLQYQLLQLHGAAGAAVTAVGDDDQSIYAWRHALGYEGMVRFERDFNARRLVVPINYRSRPEILRAANTLIGYNHERVPKTLEPALPAGGTVQWHTFATQRDEAAAVATRIAASGGQWAVLGRTNWALYPTEAALTARGIPYQMKGGKSLWQEREASILMALSELALTRTGRRGLDRVGRYAGITEESLKVMAQAKADGLKAAATDLPGLDRALATGLIERLEAWRTQLAEYGDARVPLVLLGMGEWMKQVRGRDMKEEVLDTAVAVISKMNGALSDRIAWVKRMADRKRDAKEETPDPNAVYLYTMHGSKGLEWDNVWVVQARAKVIPDARSATTDERRLMFVALTRARHTLYVSHHGEPSVFVMEAGFIESPAAAAG